MSLFLEKFRVYQLSLLIAKDIVDLVGTFPRGQAVLCDQLRRAALSIPANVSEGAGRTTPKDRQQFYAIARGSAQESVALLEAACHQGFIDQICLHKLKNRIDVLVKMLRQLSTIQPGVISDRRSTYQS